MHEQDMARLAMRMQRQAGQEAQLVFVQPRARPVDHGAGVRVHARRAAMGHGLVVVALHGDGAVGHQGHDLFGHPGGVGAIADEVAQQRKARGALGAGVGQHGLEGLSVGMDVGDESPAHGPQLATKG